MATATATQWITDVNLALERSKKEKKPALLDFTAAPM
jgi:hypothetical protein